MRSDFIADCLEVFWKQARARFPKVRTRLLNLDNGPENHSRRTQFMKRLTAFADASGLTVELAQYGLVKTEMTPNGS